jgi:hypothetical protein
MVSDEIRARLDRIPRALLAMAARRLSPDLRNDLYIGAWLPELQHILQGDEAIPITRLMHGTRFAVRLWLSAPRIEGELEPGRVPARNPNKTWGNLFPQGREIYYEGDDPARFVEQLRREFGLNPASDPNWGVRIEGGETCDDFTSYAFHCPSEFLDIIYGSDRFPMGS